MKRNNHLVRTTGFSKQNHQKNQSKNNDFILLAQQQIKLMQTECKPKTVYNCQTALRALQRYLQEMHPELGGRLPLRRLTPELIQGFLRYHLNRGVSENTIREYLRSLRSVVNRLRMHGKLGTYGVLRHDIFSLVHTSPLPVSKPSLSEGDMRRLYAAEVKSGSKEALSRDCLVFSYLAGGIPFADLARLKDSSYNPQTNELTYRRHKTGVPVKVQLTKEAHKIWERYTPAESPYHFGWIESADPMQAERQCHNALARYNRSLAKLTARCGISTAVTSYTLRHTFASVARNKYNAGTHVIAAPLGHRSERTTTIYLSRIDSGTVFTLQRKMERALLHV